MRSAVLGNKGAVNAICLDASFVLACLLPEELSEHALMLWGKWRREGRRLISPPLLLYEVASGLRRAIYLGRLSEEEGDKALDIFISYGIDIIDPSGLLDRAWLIGKQLRLSRLYDAFYLALGMLTGSEVWTVDRRLYRRASPAFPLLRWVGDIKG